MEASISAAESWLALLLFWGAAFVLLVSLYLFTAPAKCPTHGRWCLLHHPRKHAQPARGRHRKNRKRVVQV